MNRLTSLKYFQNCKHLKELYLRKNKIEGIHEIAYLKELPELQVLWMSDNPVAETENYRATVIRNLANLKKLDNEGVCLGVPVCVRVLISVCACTCVYLCLCMRVCLALYACVSVCTTQI